MSEINIYKTFQLILTLVLLKIMSIRILSILINNKFSYLKILKNLSLHNKNSKSPKFKNLIMTHFYQLIYEIQILHSF